MKKREGGILAWAAAVFLLVGMAAGCSRSEDTKGGKHYQPEVYEWTKLFEQWMNRMA